MGVKNSRQGPHAAARNKAQDGMKQNGLERDAA
jgi:hypothetical protein